MTMPVNRMISLRERYCEREGGRGREGGGEGGREEEREERNMRLFVVEIPKETIECEMVLEGGMERK